jgi:L,D-peptidoglycan transpeptidase YkuD (ErfK/YbiS/YcfS/YnhG family)
VKNPSDSRGVLKLGHVYYPCLLGKNGKTCQKREGDGKSPIGKWKLELLYFRPDKMGRPRTSLNCKPMKPFDGWCDAPNHERYNRHVALPFNASHEVLWRRDRAYDLVMITNHNQRPRKRGGGSAIFLHVISKGATSTEGCIAVSERHLQHVVSRCSKATYVVI